eukprot:scaffold1233_cov111-Cylindrotheca_fusiformis.AAC.6
MKVCILFHFFSFISAAGASFCLGDEASNLELRESAFQQEEVPAPSSAPSINVDCISQTSNARGRYTSTLAPCTFQFHKADESPRELDLIEFHTSNLCSEDNAFLSIREYLNAWPDECVGDFQRCYSLEHHRHVIWDFLCAKDWQVPDGTTHISVDCSRDKTLVLEATTHRREEYTRQEHDALLYSFEGKIFNLALILGACLVGLYAISTLIVNPLARSMNNNKDQRHVLPRSNSDFQNCTTNDGQGEGESSQSINGMEEFDSQVPDFDAVPIELHHHSSHSSNSTQSVNFELSTESETQSRFTDDFGGSEYSMEVELVPMATATTAIPMVAATILYD